MRKSTEYQIERMIEDKLYEHRGAPRNISFSKYSHGVYTGDVVVDLVWLIREIIEYLDLEVSKKPERIVLGPKQKK